MLVGSCISGTISNYENWTQRVARNTFNIGEYVAMGIKLWNPTCWAHLVESFCKEWNISHTNLYYIFFHHIWSKLGWLYDVITKLICIFLKLEYPWNKKRYLRIVNSIFFWCRQHVYVLGGFNRKDVIFVRVAL